MNQDDQAIVVREYTPAHREACLAVFASNVPDYFVPAERAEFAAFLDALPGPYLVLVQRDGIIVGCGGYATTPATGCADLCWAMVRRDLHGHGLGTLLLRERLRRIRSDRSVVAVALNTSQHTRQFYARLGFSTMRVVPNGYAPGLDRCDMRLDIGDPTTERVMREGRCG